MLNEQSRLGILMACASFPTMQYHLRFRAGNTSSTISLNALHESEGFNASVNSALTACWNNAMPVHNGLNEQEGIRGRIYQNKLPTMASDSLHACSNFSQPNAPRQYQTKNSFHGYKQTMREKERMGVAVELCNLAIVGLSSLALLFFFILATPMVLPIVIRMCCGLGVPQNYEDRSRMQVAVKRVLQKLPLMEYSGNCSSVGQNTSASTKTRFSHARCTICLDEYGTFEKVRVLPCGHEFHPICVDAWLLNVVEICPLCKRSVLPR